MRSIKHISLLLLLAAFALVHSGCIKTINGVIEDPSQNRAFVPYYFSVKTPKDSAIFTWSLPVLSAGKRYTYTVDVATDTSFNQIVYTRTVDTLGFSVVDPTLAVATKYYARMRVNSFLGSQPSNYNYITKGFTIPGLNYLRVIRDFELTSTTALIHWYVGNQTADLSTIVLSVNGSVVSTINLSPTDAAAGSKLLTNLTPGTKYTLQVFGGTKSKGIMSFTTPKTVTYTTVLSVGGDLIGAINNAADGDVIGLNPGTYTLGTSVFAITGKSVTVRSTSNNPADTKINVRELGITGNNAGVTLAGVEINGNYTGTSYGTQFLNLHGSPGAGDPTNFADITLDNCVIHDFTRCLVLGNTSTTVNTWYFKNFTINNCIIYNIDKAGTSTYYTISLEKTLFNNLNITKSTFYSMGAGMFNMSTALAATTIVPTITIDYCTFNNFGGSGKYLLIDALSNKISYTLRNSILANSPQVGSINGTAFRCTGAGSTLDFLNNNYFQLNSTFGATTPVILTGLNQVSCISANLGWTSTTTNFSLASLASGNPVFTESTSGNTVGDPRWAY